MNRVKLVSDVDAIRARFDVDVVGRLLFTAIRRDARPLVTPMLLSTPQGDRLIARQQETGNLLSSGMHADDLVLYEPWVSIDARVTASMPAAATIADAVAPWLEGSTLELDEGVALAHYRTLAANLPVTVARAQQTPVDVYELAEAEVIDWFRVQREAAKHAAVALISDVSSLDGIGVSLRTDADTRFAALAAIVERLDGAALLVAAPPNFSELTGLAAHPDLSVLWVPGSGRVLVLATEGHDVPRGAWAGSYPSMPAAVIAFAGTRVAVEQQWMSASRAIELTDVGIELRDASEELGRWRDARDCEDLGTQLIAARASVTCIEDALEFARQTLARGESLTEADIYTEYLRLLEVFRNTHQIPFDIEPYFANLTASERMLFPGPPTDHMIDPTSRCVQLDAGVQISKDGVVLATSDMARSLPMTPEGERAYALLTEIVRGTIVPALRPGVVCEDVHAATMDALEAVRDELESLGVMASGVDFVTEYRKRNVGHLMGKQESFVTELRPGYRQTLTVGAIGAAEIPWRFGEYSLAAEDMWFIGADRTYITTLR